MADLLEFMLAFSLMMPIGIPVAEADPVVARKYYGSNTSGSIRRKHCLKSKPHLNWPPAESGRLGNCAPSWSGGPSLADPVPPKPPGMWWSTYERLCAKLAVFEEAAFSD